MTLALRPSWYNNFAYEVIEGLTQRPAAIPPKYFYDAQGSKLFESITALPEYYLTRTEMGILSANAADLAHRVGTGCLLIEPGGGSCDKVHCLLAYLKPMAYVPMDISTEHLQYAVKQLSQAFPNLEIHAAFTDFSQAMHLPLSLAKNALEGTRLVFFPGSSIGNFDHESAVDFLRLIADLVGSGGYLLIGVDLKKPKTMLELAYNDKAGITAQFNLNLLSHINHMLKADFNLSAWQHKAFYNEQLGRIEMHLISQYKQVVTLNNTQFSFAEGEGIHTENAYKYTSDEFITLACRAGFQSDALWVDGAQLFSVHLLRVQENHAK